MGLVQFNSVAQSCLTLQPQGLQHARPLGPSPTSGVYLNSCPSSQWCHPTNHLILCRPLLLPTVFPSFTDLSNELALRIRWPKYWSFSISLSSEYSGLISFRIVWLDLLAVQGMLKSLLQHHSSEASVLQCSAIFKIQLSQLYTTTGKPRLWLSGSLSAKWCLCFWICCLGWSKLFFQGVSMA